MTKRASTEDIGGALGVIVCLGAIVAVILRGLWELIKLLAQMR